MTSPRRPATDDDAPLPVIDLFPDEMALARSLLASGLPAMAEGVLIRRIAALGVAGKGGLEDLDVARGLLAEALWRQGRPISAGAAAAAIRAGSPERRRPIVTLVEAEALAAAGDLDRASKLAERVVAAIGVDEVWKLRGGVPSRLDWPTPASFRAPSPRAGAPRRRGPGPAPAPTPERATTAHARLDSARLAYEAGATDEGDRQLIVALRLDPRIAAGALALFQPTLEKEPGEDRLLLYGDLLRADGRDDEAAAAFDRAARA